MDSFTAIKVFVRLKSRLARTLESSDVETPVVVDYLIVPDGDERSVRYKDSLEVGVLDGESCHHNLAQAGIVEPRAWLEDRATFGRLASQAAY